MMDQQRVDACLKACENFSDPVAEVERLQAIEHMQAGWVKKQTAYETIGIKFEQLMRYAKELTEATEPSEIKKTYETLVDVVKEFSDGKE
jgi:hypothetical protein